MTNPSVTGPTRKSRKLLILNVGSHGEVMNEISAISKLFEGVIPERLSEVVALVDKYSAQFRLVDDKEGFNLNAGAYGVVQYTLRSMQQLWLFGYAGMLSLHSYSSYLLIIQSLNLELNLEELAKIPGQEDANLEFSRLVTSVKNLAESFGASDFLWPEGIPVPEQGRSLDAERAAVFDLTCIATAYVFLHELRHVIFSFEGDAPENPVDEEYACDSFANEFMTSKIKQYSDQSGYPEDKVKMKRAMGIALSSAFLLFATSKKHLGGSSSHPPIHGRWMATANAVDLPENDYFWLYFASIALAMCQHLQISIPPKKFINFRELCHLLINDLENGI